MKTSASVTNTQIADEAAEWFVALRSEPADISAQDGFMSWLRASPEHVRAYLDIVSLWADLPGVDSLRAADAQALIARARVAGAVVALDEASSVAESADAGESAVEVAARGVFSRRARMAAAAVLAFSSIALGALFVIQTHDAGRYSTGIAEQRILKLADGSRVELNSRSRIRVRFTDRERGVELLSGQALFEVAKDATRPFLVRSGTARVRAIGTEFDVYRKPGATIVTVVEGRVAIGDAAGSTGEVVVTAGERITVGPHATLRPARADVTAATAWTRGQLIFSSEPLSAVVEEFNRYNARQIVLGDELEDFPVTAVFSSSDPGMLVEFLEQQPGLEVRAKGEEIRIDAAAPAPRENGVSTFSDRPL